MFCTGRKPLCDNITPVCEIGAISRLQTHGFVRLDSLLLMVWFVFQACSSPKSRNNKSRVSYLLTDLCKILKHGPSCRDVAEKRGWCKDARATEVLMCFALACDTGIAAHSQSLSYCHCCFKGSGRC